MTSKPQIEVSLTLTSKVLTAPQIAETMQIRPTASWSIGDHINKTEIRYKHNGWQYRHETKETLVFEDVLCELLDELMRNELQIHSMASNAMLDREISCAIYIYSEAPVFILSPSTIRRLAKLNADLDVFLILVQ
jgi:hypothetical protein